MMGFIDQIYDRAPIILQNLMVSISGYLRNRTRYGKIYREHLKFLSDFDSWTMDRKIRFQTEQLIEFLQYAVKYSSFYRKLYQGIDISRIRDIKDLKILPVVDKEMLRKNMNEIITIPRKSGVEGHTGGTTGKSLVVLFTREDVQKRMAMLDHFKARVGFHHRKMKRATFSGKHIIPPKQKSKVFWRYNAACRQMLYSSFHLTEDNLKYYVDSLNRFKPQAIDGFFSSICDVAGYMERHHIVPEFQLIAVFPTSETLTKQGRELIERVFHCKVYDQYASSEGAPFLTECREQILHQELASGVFEFMEEGSNEILVTSFTTHGTPLIRYRIGDAMIPENSVVRCKCGMEAPIVREIQGRSLDFLYTADGAKIFGGNVANLFKNIPNTVIRAQLVQESMEEIKVFIEVDKKRYQPEHDLLLEEEFRHKFGSNTRIRIIHTEKIDREISGKFRMIKNKVKGVI